MFSTTRGPHGFGLKPLGICQGRLADIVPLHRRDKAQRIKFITWEPQVEKEGSDSLILGVEIIAAVVCHQCWNIYSEKHMCPYILIQISMHTKLNSHTSTLPLTCERSPDTNMWNCVFKGLATLKKSHAQQRSVYLTLGPPPVIKTALSKPSSSERSSSSAAGGGRGGGCWRIGDIHAWWLQLTSETRKEFYLVPPGTYRKRNKKRESKAIKTKRTSYPRTPRYATSKSLKALP